MGTSELHPHFLVVVQKSNFIFMKCDEVMTIGQSILAVCACLCHRILEKGSHFVELAKGGWLNHFKQIDYHDYVQPCWIWGFDWIICCQQANLFWNWLSYKFLWNEKWSYHLIYVKTHLVCEQGISHGPLDKSCYLNIECIEFGIK